jgi:hypothetical protein
MPSPAINLVGKTGIHPYPPADEAISVYTAPHPALLPGGKERRRGEGIFRLQAPLPKIVKRFWGEAG